MYNPASIFFNQNVQRVLRPRVYWEIVIPCIVFICIAGAIIATVVTGKPTTFTPGAILVVPLLMIRKQRTERAQIYLRHTHGQEFNFGWIDLYGNPQEAPVKEYTYWCCVSHRKGFLKLYIMFDCGDKIYHLTEERIGSSAPQGWTLNEEQTKQQPGFFVISDIERLAFTIDRGSGNELTEDKILDSLK